jgi:hypothetical protein
MSARWEIGAFIVALMTLFISVSPPAMAILEKVFRYLNCLIWPARGRCVRLLWNDIREDQLHQCDPHSCSHTTDQPHNARNCWDDTLGRAFNRTWYFINADSNIRNYLAKKPNQLPLKDEFIQTDVQTLKAYLLLTTDVCRTCETVDTVTLLEIQRSHGVITIHLPLSGPVPINPRLTKFEIDRIIEGYPPFYRENITTTGGVKVPFPTTNTDHVGRGAWVLSVGMTTSSGPTPSLYNMQRVSHERPNAYWRGTLVLTAFHMIGRTLTQLKAYEDSQGDHPRLNPSKHPWSQDALTCFHIIMNSEYSSQPWPLKKEQVEGSELFKSLMGGCPCYHKCIGDSNHSV